MRTTTLELTLHACAAAELAEAEAQARDDARGAAKADAKRARRDDRERLEEMLPRATGREARGEARIARREEARARDVSPDAHVTGGGSAMGGTDSFAAAVARQRRQQDARTQRMVRSLPHASPMRAVACL
jgi:hypothetical protein